jgi:hypothetical protein
MKYLLVFLMFCFQTSFGQSDSTIYFKEFGWIIKLPSDFKIKKTSDVLEMENASKKMLKESTNVEANVSANVNLITASKGSQNIFASNYTNSLDLTAENWNETDSTVKQLILKTFMKQIPIKPDTINSIVLIDGIIFKKLEAIFKINDKIQINWAYLATYYKGHNLSATYIYIDSLAGKQILNILNTSKFEK